MAQALDPVLASVLRPLLEKQHEPEVWAASCCGRAVVTVKAPEGSPACKHCGLVFRVARLTREDLGLPPQ